MFEKGDLMTCFCDGKDVSVIGIYKAVHAYSGQVGQLQDMYCAAYNDSDEVKSCPFYTRCKSRLKFIEEAP